MVASPRLRFVVLLFFFIFAGTVYADHASPDNSLDKRALPYPRVYDPLEHEHYDITSLSFQELDAYLGQPRFRKWNDVVAVCQSMELMYGRTSQHCGSTPVPFYPRRATQRAYVTFEIEPRPIVQQRLVVFVDPMYPPWSPQLYPRW
jgi:hypothetical protein